MMKVTTLHQLQTQYNADSIEFIPDSYANDTHDSRTFVCGNYQLNETTREKFGRIYLYQLDDRTTTPTESNTVEDARPTTASSVSSTSSTTAVALPTITSPHYPLIQHQVLETAAIFDLKWCPRVLTYGSNKEDATMLLGQVDADGKLIIYQYQHGQLDQSKSASLTPWLTQQVVEKASCLSLDWNNRVIEQSEPTIAISQSNSAISIYQLASTGLVPQATWTAHEYEMWIVSFNAHTPHILYSGADDCKFRGWDLRQANTIRTSLFTDTTHEMGVCSIQSHPTREHILATGSYDENLRIWDTRSIRQPLLTHPVGGGVWRVRWNPETDPTSSRYDSILCCAMHYGFAVIDVNFETESTTTTPTIATTDPLTTETSPLNTSHDAAISPSSSAISSSKTPIDITCSTQVEYKAHSSLAYGGDWCSRPWTHTPTAVPTSSTTTPTAASASSLSDLIATCSFYDKQVNVWTIEREGTK